MKRLTTMTLLVAMLWSLVEEVTGQVHQLWYPEGTVIEVHGEEMTLVAPEQWTYLGRLGDGTLLKIAGTIKVSCDCTAASGNCSPFYLDGQVGCSTSDCAACQMTVSGLKNGVFVELTEGAFQKLSEPVRFANEGESLPQGKGIMFEAEETLDKLKDFLRITYGSQILPELIRQGDGSWAPPSRHAIVGLNWCGRGVIFAVPESPSLPAGGGGNAACSCTNGTCTLESQWVPGHGTGYSCQSDCSGTCTLTVKMASGGGTLNVFTAYKF